MNHKQWNIPRLPYIILFAASQKPSVNIREQNQWVVFLFFFFLPCSCAAFRKMFDKYSHKGWVVFAVLIWGQYQRPGIAWAEARGHVAEFIVVCSLQLLPWSFSQLEVLSNRRAHLCGQRVLSWHSWASLEFKIWFIPIAMTYAEGEYLCFITSWLGSLENRLFSEE